jgi:hypothetical protein
MTAITWLPASQVVKRVGSGIEAYDPSSVRCMEALGDRAQASPVPGQSHRPSQLSLADQSACHPCVDHPGGLLFDRHRSGAIGRRACATAAILSAGEAMGALSGWGILLGSAVTLVQSILSVAVYFLFRLIDRPPYHLRPLAIVLLAAYLLWPLLAFFLWLDAP